MAGQSTESDEFRVMHSDDSNVDIDDETDKSHQIVISYRPIQLIFKNFVQKLGELPNSSYGILSYTGAIGGVGLGALWGIAKSQSWGDYGFGHFVFNVTHLNYYEHDKIMGNIARGAFTGLFMGAFYKITVPLGWVYYAFGKKLII